MAMVKCPVCGVSVKDENLLRHVRNQHPHEDVEGLEAMRPARKKTTRDWKDDLMRVGTVVAIAGAVWLVIALLIPVPIGVVVPALPDLIVLTFVGVALLAVGWVLGSAALQRSGPKLAAVGAALGLALAGSAALLGSQQALPTLSSATIPQPQGWVKANNAVWKSGGLPVVFYYGSAGCPFCAASSWALQGALQQFGSLTGYTYTTSDPTDVNPNTPEVDLAHASFPSSFLTLDVKAGDDNQHITVPPVSAVENAYVVTYNPGGSLPFYSVGGIYFRVGAIVDPSLFVQGGTVLTPAQVVSILSTTSGPIYAAVHQAQVYFEAFMVKACQAAGITPPPAVMQDSAVVAALAQIT